MMDADLKAAYEEMSKHDAEIDKLNGEALEFVKLTINYPFDFITEMLDDQGYWEHIGYVDLEKSDYKSGSYPTYDFYVEPGKLDYHYMRQDDEGEYHNMVWQTVGYLGDDYSGYLLFPLSNGKYWKIRYAC